MNPKEEKQKKEYSITKKKKKHSNTLLHLDPCNKNAHQQKFLHAKAIDYNIFPFYHFIYNKSKTNQKKNISTFLSFLVRNTLFLVHLCNYTSL